MGHHEKNGKSDEWYTPKYVFDAMDCRFDMDVASPMDRSFCCVPTSRYITENSLQMEWNGFIWCNPPFGGRNGIVPWLDKCFDHGNCISLAPDRTSCPWWQKEAKRADAFLLVAGKIKFIDIYGNPGTKPGNGTTLFAYGSHAKNVLLKAEENGLGKVFVTLRHDYKTEEKDLIKVA